MQQPPVLPGYDLSSEVGPKEPHHHYCAIGLTRACLLIRQPLLREHTVSPDGEEAQRVVAKGDNDYGIDFYTFEDGSRITLRETGTPT
ncbi:hypothetical protein AVEN_46601-1 [Araneus ventricosus]|uniref:Uncharacterized protein n=1 Tax=Araneus ventricosus TaxID=182803 RepID=A0A4Y2TQM8_ARAVE|nr:hypothetical protein AVEN_193548-1 [Araneus ventricosus]GBO01728.1 hypothetical protein AVEN_46601-1 [Araneus ventricosus]